ncbi:hypothetical protein JHK85_040941 [Glycine max]|nr:hypothetical protein JHK85_040941 [Glycine max]
MPTVSCTSNVAHQNVNAHPSTAYSSFKGQSASAANVSAMSVGVSENKNDDYDCESEYLSSGQIVSNIPLSDNMTHRSLIVAMLIVEPD